MSDKVATVPWKCPSCGAAANEHGRGACERRALGEHGCLGFICDCASDAAKGHGQTFNDPCDNARCYHCEWAGVFPVPPKGLQPWERKALEAGWSPPKTRAKELGVVVKEARKRS